MNGWLITNEFLHGNKYTEINQWLMKAAEMKNITLEIRTNAEILVDLRTENQIISKHNSNLNSKDDFIHSLSDLDFILFWDKDIRLASYFEQLGIKVFNSSEAIAICDDKSLTHMCLHKAGIPMPRTILAPMTYANVGYTNYNFIKVVIKELGFPMIVKECFGSFGMQVYLAHNEEELIQMVENIGAKPFLFQEYVACSSGKDIRIHVVGEKVVTSMYRYSDNGDFRANITNGGKMKPYNPSLEEQELAIQCCKAIGLDFAGIDLLFGPNGKPLVCEVNSNAHFKNIYDCTGVNVADYIMDYILDNM